MGYVTEIDDEPEVPVKEVREQQETHAQVSHNVKGLKGRRRLADYTLGRTKDLVERGVMAKYFGLLWSAMLKGRGGRLERKADELAEAHTKRVLQGHWALWMKTRALKLEEAEGYKAQGNGFFAKGEYDDAVHMYSKAIDVAPKGAPEAAVYYGNRAACRLKEEQWRRVEEDCTHALRLNPNYEKALLRRMTACHKLGGDDWMKAADDAEALLKAQPNCSQARSILAEVGPIVEQRRKEQMDEAMQGLKNIGNSVLGYFGFSLDNFKTTQNPDGTYGVAFQQ